MDNLHTHLSITGSRPTTRHNKYMCLQEPIVTVPYNDIESQSTLSELHPGQFGVNISTFLMLYASFLSFESYLGISRYTPTCTAHDHPAAIDHFDHTILGASMTRLDCFVNCHVIIDCLLSSHKKSVLISSIPV